MSSSAGRGGKIERMRCMLFSSAGMMLEIGVVRVVGDRADSAVLGEKVEPGEPARAHWRVDGE